MKSIVSNYTPSAQNNFYFMVLKWVNEYLSHHTAGPEGSENMSNIA